MATTTPNYGWDVPTSTDYVKDGATAIETLGDDIDATLWTALGGAYPGLRLIKKQTIGSAVSTVAVTSAFSATYDNYRIVISGGTASASDAISFTFTGTATQYYSVFSYSTYTPATASAVTQNNTASFNYLGFANTTGLSMNLDVFNPFATKYTQVNGGCAGESYAGQTSGINKTSTSHTGFTISHSGGGTFTGGTIYVYGYGAS